MLRTGIRPKARDDLRELAQYIAQDDPDSALRFLSATEAAFALLLEMPQAGHVYRSLRDELTGIRRLSVPGFQMHVIFYRPTSNGLDVLRVLHSARDLDHLALEDE
ncbi:MAG TPA: type II toxin-antitoxin system RelE/ParE family toxin [Armatimonadota bacterium]|jgi:toxin ParE1/3/4